MASQRVLRKHRLYCLVEKEYFHIWRELNDGPPDKCPNGHTSISLLDHSDEIAENKIRIAEETVSTGGHYQETSYRLTAEPNATSHLDIQFPYPISVISSYCITEEVHRNDWCRLEVNPNISIGTLTKPITAADQEIYVELSTAELLFIGMNIRIMRPPDTYSPYTRITTIDTQTGKVVLEHAISTSFAQEGSVVQVTVSPVPKLLFSAPGKYAIGSDKIGASYIPKNATMRVSYHNNSPTDTKTFVFYNSYLY